MIVKPFEPWHVDLMRAQGVQGAQLRAVSHVPATYASLVQPVGPSVSAFDADRILICGGIASMGLRRGVCWALMSENTGKHMLKLHRAVERFLTIESWTRLEATVEEGFMPGCRWVELLGFQFEGKMPKYGDDGETHLRYGRYA